MLISNKVCRLCLLEVGNNIIPLFNHFKNTDLCSQIFHLTGVQIYQDTSLPSNICELCYNRIETFEQFKYQVQKTESILRQQMESVKKEELNVESQVDSIIQHSYMVEKVVTSVSDEKEQERKRSAIVPSSSFKIYTNAKDALTIKLTLEISVDSFNEDIVPTDLTNTLSETVITNEFDEKGKEECTDAVVIFNLEPEVKKPLNCVQDSSIDSQEQNHYAILQKIWLAGAGETSENTVPAENYTGSKEKLPCRTLQCEICHKIFKTKTTLRRHQVVHTGQEYHKCVECHKIFAHKHNLVKHFRIHSGIMLTCTVCQKMFTQPEYLKNHMTNTHSGDPLSCDVCGRLYKNSVTLMVHKKTVHAKVTGTNKTICTVCGKLLGSNALSKHMKTHNINERIKCDLCDKSYKNRYIMMEHRKSHLKLPSWCCDVCGKTFKTNGILKNHKLTHLTEKQFSCGKCDAKFTQSAALRTHQRVHTGVEPYTCSCGEKFKWKQTYDKHKFKCMQRQVVVY